jgi:hypothetical protein
MVVKIFNLEKEIKDNAESALRKNHSGQAESALHGKSLGASRGARRRIGGAVGVDVEMKRAAQFRAALLLGEDFF